MLERPLLTQGSSRTKETDMDERINVTRGRDSASWADLHRYVFCVAMRYLKDEDAAADVAQDTLLRAYCRRDTFRGQSLFSTWLYRIAQTTSLMHLRKEKRRARAAAEWAQMPPDSVAPTAAARNPEALHAAREQVALARKRLGELGVDCERVLELSYLGGYTHKEIGEIMGMPASTAKTRAFRARRLVREALSAA